MNRILFKLIGMTIGIALMFLSFAWGLDTESGALVLFFGAVLVFLGASKSDTMEITK